MRKFVWFGLGTGFGAILTACAVVLALGFSVNEVKKTPAPGKDTDEQFQREAARTVRPIVDSEGDVACSVVVLRPGVARTATHCLPLIVTVDGLKPTRITYQHDTDAAILEVPGLQCPCAVEAQSPAAAGEIIYAVGFPYYGPPQPSPQVITGPGTVVRIGTINARLPQCPLAEPVCRMDFIEVEPAILDGGQSGGGAFVLRDGHWVLIGTNSVGYGPNGLMDATHSGFSPITVIQ